MNDELQELIRFPREDIDIELKQWMDPTDKLVQAKLAKELLALRNHGGGYLVLGFKDEHPPLPDPNRPADLSGFSTDYFNNIIKKYAEPPFHCMSHVIAHPVTGETHPVIVVPSGATVPVRCKSESSDGGKTIKLDTYYIRRPGPESSPIQSGAEWDALLQRCLIGRKEELLAALSNLLKGNEGTLLAGTQAPEPPHPFADLRAFRDSAVARLEKLQAEKLPDGDPARFLHGRYILSTRIVGNLKLATLTDLLRILSGLRRYTGWSPMYIFTRRELEPYPIGDGMIECWLARDEARDVGHSDFWRASTDGMVTLIRGYQEDGLETADHHADLAAGTGIELTLPAWRVAEYLLRVKELGEKLSDQQFTLQLLGEWEGLEGRKLFSHGGRRDIFDDYVSHDPKFRVELEISPEEIDGALPAVVAKIITPLLRKFSFFEPPRGFYEQEMAKFLKREFT